jgi:hypothetical protein
VKAAGPIAAIPRTHLNPTFVDHSYVLTDAVQAARCVLSNDALRGTSEVWTRGEDRDPFVVSLSRDRDRGWGVDCGESGEMARVGLDNRLRPWGRSVRPIRTEPVAAAPACSQAPPASPIGPHRPALSIADSPDVSGVIHMRAMGFPHSRGRRAHSHGAISPFRRGR